MSLVDFRDDFAAIAEAQGDDEALSKYGAVLWSLERAPKAGLDLAAEEQRLGMEGVVPGPFICTDLEALQGRRGSVSMARGRFAAESVVRYLHASGDLFGQLIRTALLRHTSLTEACTASDVRNATLKEPGLAAVSSAFDAYLESPAFVFAADATNRMKHRDWMPFRQWGRIVDSGGLESGSAVGPFRHGERAHQEVDLNGLRDHAAVLLDLGAQLMRETIAAANPRTQPSQRPGLRQERS
jgi:hypothetical protein